MVFQDYALFPHMDVWHNVAYGVRDKSKRESRVGDVLELVGLSGMQRRLPHELSGGEQQRVALARALAPGPAVVLLDETFSNLDGRPQSQGPGRSTTNIERCRDVGYIRDPRPGRSTVLWRTGSR